MSYDSLERSEYGSLPIELYTFSKSGSVWRYNSGDQDYVFDGRTFSAIPISRGDIEATQEMARSNITITLAKTASFLTQFRASPPTALINFKLQRFHFGESELVTLWLGRVVNVKFLEREAEIRCEPIYTSLKRPVLRMRYQTTCPHVLYSNACGVSRAAYAVSAVLLTNGGTSLTAAAFANQVDGYFTGGYVDWAHDGTVDRRFITSHTGQTIQINLPFAAIQGGANITAYPGCNHLLGTCNTKFSNEINYGGQPFYPGKNPLTGSSIY